MIVQGDAADIFTGAFVSGSYANPAEFTISSLGGSSDTDGGFGGDHPIVADPSFENSNIHHYVTAFLAWAESQANRTHGSNILALMGTDYQWEQADKWYA